MEDYITISTLNVFIFCPRSIYFHHLFGNISTRLYHSICQVNGNIAHASIEAKNYSTRKYILQGLEVYSEKYGLCGKIDILDLKKGLLTERKKKIKVVYDGYIFQLYAQYHALVEMGYEVKKICLYSMDDNKKYDVLLPCENKTMQKKFEQLLKNLRTFSLEKPFVANSSKCEKCIYNTLCDEALC